jgi:uncharacterized protein
MHALLSFNPWLTSAVLAWVLAQVMKLVLNTIVSHRVDFSRLVDTGGMPSSHTAFVAALSGAVGLTEGFRSVIFAAVLCFSMIIVYDATNLRRSAGYHAQVLNDIVPALLKGKVLQPGIQFPKLRELLGHNPSEVIVGAMLGLFMAYYFIVVWDGAGL